MSAPLDTDASAVVDANPGSEAPFKTPLVVKLLVAATFVVILNETTMINAMPSLIRDFDVSEATAQWVTTVFLLTMASVIPLTGWFLQRVTTRTAFAVAMTTFSVGTLLGALAPSFEVLLLARGVQAAGTAVMMPLLMTTVMTVIPMQERGRVMGNMMLAISVAPALGPAISGLLLDLGSWRFIFAAILPLAVLMGIAGVRLLDNIGEPQAGPVSWLSVVLAASGFAVMVYGLTSFADPDAVAKAVGFALAGLALVTVFVLYQLRLQRSGSPLLDLRTLNVRTFAVSVVLMAFAFMAFFGAMVLLPLYLQEPYRGLTPVETGLLVMPGGLAMGLLGPRVGRLFDRFGTRPLVIPGSVGMIAGLLLLSRIDMQTPYGQIMVLHILLMASLALVFTPVFTLGLGSLPQTLYSHGSSLLGTTQQVAGAAGMALLISILVARAKHLSLDGVAPADAFVGGMSWALLAGAGFGLVVLVMAVLLPARAPEGAGHGH